MTQPLYTTHGGSISIPNHTCQTLGEIRSSTGWSPVTPQELAKRKAIERQHDGNDDGTLTHYTRQHGDRSEYSGHNDLPDPIGDHSPIHVLAFYGLGTREIKLLERHGCETISDVRDAIDSGELAKWWQIEAATREKISDAVGMVTG